MVTGAAAPPGPAAPALYRVVVRHTRREPVVNRFRYRSYLWLIDVDRPPRLPRALAPFARFPAADHVGDPAASLRANVEACLGRHGLPAPARVLMLAGGRTLGYAFDPISLFWCYRPDGGLSAVIAEVHNTYGARHAYLLRPDASGRAETPKALYVSPFYDVSGRYRISVPEPGRCLRVAVTLHRPGAAPFVATLTGRRIPATTPALLRLLLRYPLAPLRVRARIWMQGVRLWGRGLRPVPRPEGSTRGEGAG
jgi:DUF1365 family protein